MIQRFFKPIFQALVPPIIFFGIFFLYYGVPSLRRGYSWQDMDWDNDGHTSIAEFIAAKDVGRHEILLQGKKCVEYFSLADGAPVKTNCT